MSLPVVWPGSASYSDVTTYTAFDIYDDDAEFISASVEATYWAARRLGYPVMDVELANENFFACFEEAVNEYSYQINNFNITENMLILQGSSTGSNLQGRQIRGGLGRIVKLTDYYGQEVGAGGDVDWKEGSINVVAGEQSYDLDALWADVSESGAEIRIKRIFHYRTPASTRYFDPYGLPTNATQNLVNSLGFNSFSGAGTAFILRPLYEDLLRMQAIELNDQFRKSGYSFEIINNKIRLFPRPATAFKLWFHYVIKADADSGFVSGSEGTGLITDPSNVPYSEIPYNSINSIGQQWIRNYFLAACKDTLGAIRGKYSTIPIPNSEVTLDGDTLRSEAIAEKERLIEQLRDSLEKMSRRAQMEAKQEEDDNLQKIINKVPMKIFVGIVW